MTQENLTVNINVRIAPSIKEALERIAQSNRFAPDVSTHVRVAIEEYIERESKETVAGERTPTA